MRIICYYYGCCVMLLVSSLIFSLRCMFFSNSVCFEISFYCDENSPFCRKEEVSSELNGDGFCDAPNGKGKFTCVTPLTQRSFF